MSVLCHSSGDIFFLEASTGDDIRRWPNDIVIKDFLDRAAGALNDAMPDGAANSPSGTNNRELISFYANAISTYCDRMDFFSF